MTELTAPDLYNLYCSIVYFLSGSHQYTLLNSYCTVKQDSVLVGCEPPVCRSYVLHNEQVRKCLEWRARQGPGPMWGPVSVVGMGVPCIMSSHVRGSLTLKAHVQEWRAEARGSLHSEVQCGAGRYLYSEMPCLQGLWWSAMHHV